MYTHIHIYTYENHLLDKALQQRQMLLYTCHKLPANAIETIGVRNVSRDRVWSNPLPQILNPFTPLVLNTPIMWYIIECWEYVTLGRWAGLILGGWEYQGHLAISGLCPAGWQGMKEWIPSGIQSLYDPLE